MKKLIAILGLLSFLSSSILYADGVTILPIDVPYKIEANVAYTFDKPGWVFSQELELKNREKLLEIQYLQDTILLKDKVISNYKTELDLQVQITQKYKNAWEDTEGKLTDSLTREGRNKFLYLIGGVLLTVAAGVALGASANAL